MYKNKEKTNNKKIKSIANLLSKKTKRFSITQFKPKNINSSHLLNIDNAGSITNAEADRVDPPVSYPLNTAINLGLLKSKSGAAVGGHLFKREYGGLDNYSNVVTWSEKSEKSFTEFENRYLQEAHTDAVGKGGVKRQVKTNATFSKHMINLNNINLPDKEEKTGRTIGNASKKDEKEAKYLITKVIRGALESIPETVKVETKGGEPWSKEGKENFMKISEVDEEQVARRFDDIADEVGNDKIKLLRASAKIDEMK